MMLSKTNILGAAVVLALSGAAQAGTSPILFDYTGGTVAGSVITVGSFDWTQDNALAIGAVPLPTAPAQNTFDLYYQASLGNFVNPSNVAITGTGLGTDFEITIQMGFTELGTATVIPGFGALALFELAPTTTVNFINIYYDMTVNANQAAGTGYGDGTVILSGVIVGNNTSFFVPFIDSPEIVALDNFGNNDLPGVTTVKGSGGGIVEVDVQSVDGNYFLSNILALLIDIEFNTSVVTPFSQAQPSALVVGYAPYYGPGNINGIDTGCTGVDVRACDFHLQADANQAFYTTVPEPGSLLLLGAGLMGMGWAARRRKA